MTKEIYLVVGTPGSGKSWVCSQLTDKFDYIPHDEFDDTNQYLSAIKRMADFTDKPVLIETPFSVSQILKPLTAYGLNVHPVFIIESPELTAKRYYEREGKDIPQGHLTRINTYIDRAQEYQAPNGSSQFILNYLKSLK